MNITEDYVSYEVAKLLKEKGFDESCDKYYPIKGGEVEELTLDELNYHRSQFIKAPTHQMAMKWLRKKYKIMITIIPQEVNVGVDRMHYAIYRITEDLYQPLYNGKVDSLIDSYEELVEAALKYSLENLI